MAGVRFTVSLAARTLKELLLNYHELFVGQTDDEFRQIERARAEADEVAAGLKEQVAADERIKEALALWARSSACDQPNRRLSRRARSGWSRRVPSTAT